MEVLNIKIEKGLLQEIDQNLKKYRYSTRTEFVREAIRDKLSELEKDDLLKAVAALQGVSKHNTSYKQLDKARTQIAKELEQKFKTK